MLLTLGEKEYVIPEKWTQVKLGSYQKFMQNTSEDLDKHTSNMNAINAIVGVEHEVLEKCKASDVNEIVNALEKLATTKINETLNLIITIDDVDFGFHPNLKEMTFAEFVDLDNYLENPLDNLHKLMGVLYRPINNLKNKGYDIVPYDSVSSLQNAKLFQDKLSIATVNGAAAFFLSIGQEYLIILQSYLKSRKRKQTIEIPNNNSAKSGVGTE